MKIIIVFYLFPDKNIRENVTGRPREFFMIVSMS